MALQNTEKRYSHSEQNGRFIQQVTDVPGIFAYVFKNKVPALLARKSRVPLCATPNKRLRNSHQALSPGVRGLTRHFADQFRVRHHTPNEAEKHERAEQDNPVIKERREGLNLCSQDSTKRPEREKESSDRTAECARRLRAQYQNREAEPGEKDEPAKYLYK